MRKKQTFLLTILTPESEDASFCGRLKVIASGKTCTFSNLDELDHLIASEMDDQGGQNFSAADHKLDAIDRTASF